MVPNETPTDRKNELIEGYDNSVKPYLEQAIENENLLKEAINKYLDWIGQISDAGLEDDEDLSDLEEEGYSLIELGINAAMNRAQERLKNAGTNEKLIMDAINELLDWERVIDLLDLQNQTALSEIGHLAAQAIDAIIEEVYKKCKKSSNPCEAFKKKIEAVNKIYRYEKAKDVLGGEVQTKEEISRRIFGQFKLNYDVTYDSVLDTTATTDYKSLVYRFIPNVLIHLIARIFPLGKRTEQKTKNQQFHHQVNDLSLELDIKGNNLVMTNPATVKTSTVGLPDLSEIPAEIRSDLFSSTPIIGNFELRFKCEDDCAKDLIMDLSCNLPGKDLISLNFALSQLLVSEIDSNIRDKWEKWVKETEVEIKEDTAEWERESNGTYTLPGAVGVAGDILGDAMGYLAGLEGLIGKPVNFKYKKWNIVGTTPFAIKTCKGGYSGTSSTKFFSNGIKVNTIQNITVNINIELVHIPVQA
ncbi:MAG: hypothetical protein ACFFC7_30845 [Candidatus Hermodarchaeota archaeon]